MHSLWSTSTCFKKVQATVVTFLIASSWKFLQKFLFHSESSLKNHYLKTFSNQLFASMDTYLQFTHRISVFEHFHLIFEMLLIHVFVAFWVCLDVTVHTFLKRLDPFLSLLMSNNLQNNKFRLSFVFKIFRVKRTLQTKYWKPFWLKTSNYTHLKKLYKLVDSKDVYLQAKN